MKLTAYLPIEWKENYKKEQQTNLKNIKNILIIIPILLIISLSLAPNFKPINLANAQISPCDNGQIIGSSQILPVILIHGYAEPSNVWSTWERLLSQNNIPFCTVSFHQSNDECGSAISHATELAQIVQQVKSMTGQNKVNIVAHSKGGLDARVYLANTNTQDVANLIMIGTPNAGTPAALLDFTDCPSGSGSDLLPGSPATQVIDRPQSTNYYTIAGNWLANDLCWNGIFLVPDGGNCFIPGPDDGLVPVKSVQSSSNYFPLGVYPYFHNELVQQRDVFERALQILDK